MRLSETLNLRMGDINTSTCEIMIGNDHFVTKSKKKQVLPIASVTPLKELARKMLVACTKNDERLFSHSCRRHTCCIELLRAGVPIYNVQRWLRHSDVKTTQRYADLLNMESSEQIGRVF